MKRAVLYLRVSTVDQTTANQERELREVACQARPDLDQRRTIGRRTFAPMGGQGVKWNPEVRRPGQLSAAITAIKEKGFCLASASSTRRSARPVV